MSTPSFYGPQHRALQDQFGTRPLADRLSYTTTPTFDEFGRSFVERCDMFFLATVDHEGRPTVSYKGGDPGFVKTVDESTLLFPSYDGNGMFRSMGNIVANPQVGMLFIDFTSPRRLRVNGAAAVHKDDALLDEFVGAELLVRVKAVDIFPNCPRYIHALGGHASGAANLSADVPAVGHTPPEPEWKRFPAIAPYLPRKT